MIRAFLPATFGCLLALTVPAVAQVAVEGTANFSGDSYFNVGQGGAVYNATPTSFSTGTVGSNRMLIVPVAWRNETVNSITFGGQTLSQATTIAGNNNYNFSYYYLGEAGLAAASGDEFVITMSADGNTSLIFQATVLSGAAQTQPTATTASATSEDPPSLPAMTLNGLAGNGHAFSAAVIENGGSATIGSIDTATFAWAQDLDNQAFNAHTGGKLSTADYAFSAGGNLTADWQDGAAFGPQNTIGATLYVSPVPEPGTAALVAGGLTLLALCRRRRS